MQPKSISLFTPFLANVFFTLVEICALKSYENQSIKREYIMVENRLIRKEKLNMTFKVLKLPYII